MVLRRKKNSHKGDNGRVLVVGGNEEYHGAGIFGALGAEMAGADLVRIFLPASQKTVARKWSLNFIVSTFVGEYLKISDVEKVIRYSEKSDVLVMGMGLGDKKTTQDAVKRIIHGTFCPLVLDADALVPSLSCLVPSSREVVVTPHFGEAKKMMWLGEDYADTLAHRKKLAHDISLKYGVTTVLKGVIDCVSDRKGKVKTNSTGNAGMTVGGTGDVLAGVIGSLIAQGMNSPEAGLLAVKKLGQSGDKLSKAKGFRYTAEEVARGFEI